MSIPSEEKFLKLLKQELDKAGRKAVVQGNIKPELQEKLEKEYNYLFDQYKLALKDPKKYLQDLEAKQKEEEIKKATTTHYFDTKNARPFTKASESIQSTPPKPPKSP